jgi:tetratricopeptide (TPR) repeat protein
MRWTGCGSLHVRIVAVALALSATPALADQKADAHKTELDRLFKALKAAPDEDTAAQLEGRIRGLWVEEASPAAVLLLNRGDRNLHANADDDAVQDFDAVLALEPNYAEGYNHRAVARAAAGDYAGAIRDIEAVLTLDPRHFSALQGLSHIAEQQGNWRGALEAWQKALDIDPRTPGGLERLDMLQKKVDGEAT